MALALRRLRRHLSFANVASALALFTALSTGGAYASHLLVDGTDVRDESLTGADVRGRLSSATTAAVNGTLTGADISGQPELPSLGQPYVNGAVSTWDLTDESIQGRDVKDGGLSGADVRDGSVGSEDVRDGTIGWADVQPFSLTGRHLASDSLGGDEIREDSLEDVVRGDARVTGGFRSVEGLVGTDAPRTVYEIADLGLLQLQCQVFDGVTKARLVPYDASGAGADVRADRGDGVREWRSVPAGGAAGVTDWAADHGTDTLFVVSRRHALGRTATTTYDLGTSGPMCLMPSGTVVAAD